MGEIITSEICRGQGKGDSPTVCRRYVVLIFNSTFSLCLCFFRSIFRVSIVCRLQVVIVENQPFGHLNLHVRQGVFIPRWETEEWSIALAARLRKHVKGPFTLVDLCSGSGCIPLLLKSFVSAELQKGLDQKYGPANPLATFVGIEKSPIAAEVARQNLKRNNLHPEKLSDGYPPASYRFLTFRTIYFLNQDILRLPPASFQGRVDIITCNPPYIPLSSRPTLSKTVSKYEPSEALFVNSPHGDEYYHLLHSIATRWGTNTLVMEVGDIGQAERVRTYFISHGWTSSMWLDSAEKGRVVVAIKSEKWSFLLSQPNYSVPVDLSPFPRQKRPRHGVSGSIISAFKRPKLVVPEIPPRLSKREKEKESGGGMGFVDRLLEKLRIAAREDEGQSGLIKYLEDLKRISK